MRGSSRNIHTIYHVMEARGDFDLNPANSTARDSEGLSTYSGPVEFPKMLYHPKGATRVTVPAELVLTPGGREIQVGEQRELIWRLATTLDEEAGLLTEGWHTSPSKSIAAANDPNRPAPAESPAQVILDKDGEIARLREQLAAAQAQGAKPSRGQPASVD